jgi:DNA-binding NtrC family response regulator
MVRLALQCGKDLSLLEIRSEVLHSAGLCVVNTISIAECIRKFLSGRFDLVILCHSLSIEERTCVAHLIHHHSHSTPVILISTFGERDQVVDAVIEAKPQKLVAGVQEIIRGLHGTSLHSPSTGAIPA